MAVVDSPRAARKVTARAAGLVVVRSPDPVEVAPPSLKEVKRRDVRVREGTAGAAQVPVAKVVVAVRPSLPC